MPERVATPMIDDETYLKNYKNKDINEKNQETLIYQRLAMVDDPNSIKLQYKKLDKLEVDNFRTTSHIEILESRIAGVPESDIAQAQYAKLNDIKQDIERDQRMVPYDLDGIEVNNQKASALQNIINFYQLPEPEVSLDMGDLDGESIEQ